LYPFYGKYAKKFESVAQIWVTGGGEDPDISLVSFPHEDTSSVGQMFYNSSPFLFPYTARGSRKWWCHMFYFALSSTVNMEKLEKYV
jgi:hypothetical protein